MAASWKTLDDWLKKNQKLNRSFSAEVLASSLRIETWEASELIQAYLAEQRRGDEGETKYVLRRRGRTRGAVWMVGERSKDVRRRLQQHWSDMKCSWDRAVEPDLQAYADISPDLRRRIEAKIDEVFDGAFKVVEATFTDFNGKP